jgi:hypothetical protein
MEACLSDFEDFRQDLIGLEVSHIWRGHGSAPFVEFGALTPSNVVRRSGRPGEPAGELSLMVEWSWRIENRTSIVCGSWSEEDIWSPTFDMLKGRRVVDASLFGRLPEISVALTGDLFIASFMTAEGDPEWALGDRRGSGPPRWISVRDGRLQVEATPLESVASAPA